MTEACVLCTGIEPYCVAYEEPLWQVVLSRNQQYLGETMLVLRRHEELLASVSDDEALALWGLLRRVHAALQELFRPDHFNDVFLMDRERHVHLLIIPRYATVRRFASHTFEGGRLSEHYQVGYQRTLPPSAYAALAEALEEQLAAEAL